MRRLLIGVLVVTAASALGLAGPASASHAWGGYHWARTANPFTLDLGDNLSSTGWKAHLATASADWSQSEVMDTVVVAGRASRPRQCRAVTGRVEVCNYRYGSNGWLGLATINVSGTHITAGTVKVNDTYFSTSPYNTSAWRQLVMCQEVGHTFGLAHQDEDFANANLGTCMDYTNSPGTNQHPNAHDYAQLATIYQHLDSTTTVAQSLSGSPAAVGNDEGSWGVRVEGSRSAGHSTYVRDFGQGHLAVTHVLWAR